MLASEAGEPRLHRRGHLPPQPDEIDHVETVAGWQDRKLAALEAHESQFESTMFVTDGDDSQLQRFRDRELARMVDHGALVGADLGEGFKRIDDL